MVIAATSPLMPPAPSLPCCACAPPASGRLLPSFPHSHPSASPTSLPVAWDSGTGSSVFGQGLWAVAVLPFPPLPEGGSEQIPEFRRSAQAPRGGQAGRGTCVAGRECVARPPSPQRGPRHLPRSSVFLGALDPTVTPPPSLALLCFPLFL